eukprot:CAMPEP_0194179962 /NCGR_PEP_ID=MMETSP0154-20130528/13318_1 /TAXON_ID=1049557 /ORGANISM="Thalassiothrix antarctica, Strain L6-D1" /LENGTH=285 /DNA_ID=CAMNT_0038895495 /DNA_START=28 /DNA_END=885 /DNA_ORIENTATION=+
MTMTRLHSNAKTFAAAVTLLIHFYCCCSFVTIVQSYSLNNINNKPSSSNNNNIFSRRSFLFQSPSVAAAAFGITSQISTSPANAAGIPSVSEGMSAFASGDVDRSIGIYDTILENDPRRKPYLWQRGLSLYYAERYQDGADQFAADVAVNPNDTEEQIWHLLCLSQLKGVGSLKEARRFKLTVGQDRRPVMRAVQRLFLSEGGTEEEERRRQLIDIIERGDKGSKFYASMYLSLYHESMGDTTEAKKWMVQAVQTDYAQVSGTRDPMVELAKVAIQKRGWSGRKA